MDSWGVPYGGTLLVFGEGDTVPQIQLIQPAAPAPLLGEVLALTAARVLTLSAGEAFEDGLPAGNREIAACLRGAVTVGFPEGEAVLSAGGLALLTASGSFRLHAKEESQCALLRLTGELPERILAPAGACTLYPQGAAAVREAVAALTVLDREGGGIDAPTASGCAYNLLMKLLRLQGSEPSGYSLLVEAAVGLIDEEFAYLEGLDDLAARLEVSKPHLIRTFTREVGVSPGKYITHARIEYAKLLLSEPGMSISFAAEASGFAGANYFAKVFRRETGLSPSEFQSAAPRVRRKPQALRDEDRLYMT